MSGKRCHRSHGAQGPVVANAKNMTAKAKDVYAPIMCGLELRE